MTGQGGSLEGSSGQVVIRTAAGFAQGEASQSHTTRSGSIVMGTGESFAATGDVTIATGSVRPGNTPSPQLVSAGDIALRCGASRSGAGANVQLQAGNSSQAVGGDVVVTPGHGGGNKDGSIRLTAWDGSRRLSARKAEVVVDAAQLAPVAPVPAAQAAEQEGDARGEDDVDRAGCLAVRAHDNCVPAGQDRACRQRGSHGARCDGSAFDQPLCVYWACPPTRGPSRSPLRAARSRRWRSSFGWSRRYHTSRTAGSL